MKSTPTATVASMAVRGRRSLSRTRTGAFSFTAARTLVAFARKTTSGDVGLCARGQERRMRRHHLASRERRRPNAGAFVFVGAWCQPGISGEPSAWWWWRADAAAAAAPPCCKPGRPAARGETRRSREPQGSKGDPRATVWGARPRNTAELDRVRVSPPSPLCFPSTVARRSITPRGGEGTPQFRPPDADLPACGDEIVLVVRLLNLSVGGRRWTCG